MFVLRRIPRILCAFRLSGTGFLPRETAEHHRAVVLGLIKQAMDEAKVAPMDLDAIAFTKGKCSSCFFF